MSGQIIAAVIGAALGVALFFLFIGPMIDNADLRAGGIGVSIAGGAILGERLAKRIAASR